MSDFSNYAENVIINVLFRNTAFTSPSIVYLALFTAVTDAEAGTGTEVGSGVGYARRQITFSAPTLGSTSNSATITFGPATANWGAITHVGVFDALTGGNPLTAIKAITSRTVNSGDSLQFVNGNLTFTVL